MTNEHCLNDDQLYAVAEGESSDPAVAEHLRTCLDCRKRVDQHRVSMSTIRMLYQQRSEPDEGETVSSNVPRFVGKYFIAGKLREDDDFVVYRGAHSLLPADVLIYRARRPIAANDELREVLVTECRRFGALRDDAIPRLLDVEIVDDIPSMIVEHVEGRPLTDVLQEGAISQSSVDMVARLADAVATMHRNGIAHGDLRESSIVVDSDGRPHIVDLGTHQLRQMLSQVQSSSATREGAPAPTAGSEGDGRAADLRSLGRLLESLLSRTPAAGNTRHRQLDELAKRAASTSSNVYADAGEFAAEVRRSQSSAGNWKIFALIAVVAALVVALAIWLSR